METWALEAEARRRAGGRVGRQDEMGGGEAEAVQALNQAEQRQARCRERPAASGSERAAAPMTKKLGPIRRPAADLAGQNSMIWR